MLLRFGVSNFLSIKDRQELSLVASSLKDDESGLITPPASVKHRVLPAAVIYGANASGKSNVVKAFAFMRSFVLYSHSRGEPGKPTGVTPFALDPECATQPSAFDIDFVAGGISYSYSFSLTGEAVVTEELNAYPRSRPQLRFSRTEQEFKFGSSLTGRNRVIADLVRPNSLFLSAAAQNDHEQLKAVVEFFESFRSPMELDNGLFEKIIDIWRRQVDPRSLRFLEEIDSGIIGQKVTRETFEEKKGRIESTLNDLRRIGIDPPNIKEHLERNESPIVQFAHKGKSDNAFFFDFNQESTGTRCLLILLERIFRSLDAGTLLIIDEIGASVHSKASEALVALFISRKTNPRGAQLIATTHDTNLMRSPLLRRDQIWLTEKSTEGETELFSLSDFPTRSTDNLERAYMQGRFGATPFTGSARNMVEAD